MAAPRRHPLAKHVDLSLQDHISASGVALALKREARISSISLNKSIIRMQAYAVRLLRLRRISFSVYTGHLKNRTGESGCKPKFLHLIGDFSQPAILQDMSGNSVKISKICFQNCTASSNPVWSASKSLISHREFRRQQFARHFRTLTAAFARILN